MLNCGDRKEPSSDAVQKFLDVYIQIINRISFDQKKVKTRRSCGNERN